jgi:hypothetical protein
MAALVGRFNPTRFYAFYNGIGFVAMCYLEVKAISKSRSDNSTIDVIHSNHFIAQLRLYSIIFKDSVTTIGSFLKTNQKQSEEGIRQLDPLIVKEESDNPAPPKTIVFWTP